ncbi:CobW family GTP-binding protein [Pseudomonas sp. PSKL.D1]|uniref:CobW family GTP-binding protein n=1 Tax=Pseudomonas sp. PSKL.D1 TaxID=3029060 RepID=UPI002380E935|nr:CobW family GTP-binding protein [Pseudomonas sp. PSKL.D1]WDY58038.1 GTP-binding protein [Pseudomonas sp. PSKL.D1]
MLQNIPTHVIAGPLGAGKTSLIRHLMAQRPVDERWAVLVNEFGQIGLDAALLSQDEDGISIAEVAGGCLCCVNGTPFQVGLARLLRKHRPDRLFIEPSGLGHPLQLMAQLGNAPWVGVLAVQPLVMVVDAQALAAGALLNDAQQQAMDACALLIFNKSEAVDENCRLLINKTFSTKNGLWTAQGRVPFGLLPRLPLATSCEVPVGKMPVENLPQTVSALWTDLAQPICLAQQGEGGWSIGWRWHPGIQFDPQRLREFLERWQWRRAKGIIHSSAGWHSFNGLEGLLPAWQASAWRKDTRLELIFDQPQSKQALQDELMKCLAG